METSIRSFDIDKLTDIVIEYGQPKYRAKQVYEWLHTHNVTSYDEMTNVPKALRDVLETNYPLTENKVVKKLESSDGSRKYLLEFSDGNVVETVGIVGYENNGFGSDSFNSDSASSPDRLTVCASSQIGCAMECKFCATGTQGFSRNLSADEIVDQVVTVGKDFDTRVDNVVIMGQGEPFQNYDNTLDAMRRMNGDKGLNIGARHITLSTSGIIDGIYRFAEEPEQFRLAISLHSADQTIRNSLMPRLSGQPLRMLKKALNYYNEEKGRRITLEYLMIDTVNDSENALEKLIAFCDELNVHINLLPLNAIEGSSYKPSKHKIIVEWAKALSDKGIPTSIRKSRGQDISGACGQLAGKVL